MLRSLIALLLLANLNSAPAGEFRADPFDPEVLLKVEPIPSKNNVSIEPVINAKAALLMDVGTGILLYKKNHDQQLPIASLTKIMTAVLILESHKMEELVTIEDNFGLMGELGVKMWLQKYEKITVENLMTGLLVRSAGDAAVALAKHHSGSVEDFVAEMNRKAEWLNLKNTRFVNPIGLDDEGHYSTAYDLAILTKYALRNKDFRRFIQISSITVSSVDGRIQHRLDNTNYLLNSYLDVRGVKTGTTDEAGASLINLAVTPTGREMIAVLLNSAERFQENKRLIDWGLRNFLW